MKLLVVDDDASILQLFRRGIASAELDLATAGSAREALEQLGGRKFDIVLTDLVMEEMDGFRLIEACRKRHPAVDVLVMTGYPTLDAVVRALKLGAYDFIPKPIELLLVKAAIRRCVERRKLLGRLSAASSALIDASTRLETVGTALSQLKSSEHFELDRDAIRSRVEAEIKAMEKLRKSLQDG